MHAADIHVSMMAPMFHFDVMGEPVARWQRTGGWNGLRWHFSYDNDWNFIEIERFYMNYILREFNYYYCHTLSSSPSLTSGSQLHAVIYIENGQKDQELWQLPLFWHAVTATSGRHRVNIEAKPEVKVKSDADNPEYVKIHECVLKLIYRNVIHTIASGNG